MEPRDPDKDPELNRDPNPGGDGGTGTDDDPRKWDAERSANTILKQRESENKLRAQLRAEEAARKAAEKKAQDYEAAQLSEQEKLQKRAEEAERAANERLARLRQQAIDGEILRRAASMNFVDLDDPIKLIDRNGIEVDDDLRVAHVEKALNELVKTKPHLLKGGVTREGPPRNQGDTTPLSEREALRRRTEEEMAPGGRSRLF